MRMANANPTTTTRRGALGLGAVVLASFTAPALATAAACSPDTALIKLCNDLIEHVAAIDRFCETRKTIEDEEQTNDALIAMFDRQYELIDQIEPLVPPKTTAGLMAVARASLAAHADKSPIGDVRPSCDGHWLGLVVLESIADGNL